MFIIAVQASNYLQANDVPISTYFLKFETVLKHNFYCFLKINALTS